MSSAGAAIETAVEVRLIVEIDDELRASFLRPRHLNELGAVHKGAESLDEARSALQEIGRRQKSKANSMVLLLDLMFPDDYNVEEGMQFIRDVRSGILGIHHLTPIIVLSNSKNPDVVNDAMLAGANDFFSKTENSSLVLKQLDFYLGGSIRESQDICEVSEVDLAEGRIRVRLRAANRWILERWVPINFCPPEVRVSGGAFYWETMRCFRDYSVQYISQAKLIEDDGGEAVERLLYPEG
jgi:CheY-like chemotaxis protein